MALVLFNSVDADQHEFYINSKQVVAVVPIKHPEPRSVIRVAVSAGDRPFGYIVGLSAANVVKRLKEADPEMNVA